MHETASIPVRHGWGARKGSIKSRLFSSQRYRDATMRLCMKALPASFSNCRTLNDEAIAGEMIRTRDTLCGKLFPYPLRH